MEILFDFYNRYYEKNGDIICIETNSVVAQDNTIYFLKLPKNVTDILAARGVTTISNLLLIGNAFLQHNGLSINEINTIYNSLVDYLNIEKEEFIDDDNFDFDEDEGNFDFIFEDVFSSNSSKDSKDSSNIEIEETKEEWSSDLFNDGEEYDFLDESGDFSYDEIYEAQEKIIKKDTFGNIPIETLELSVRTYNALKKEGINFLEELLEFDIDYFSNIKNIGKKSLDEIQKILIENNLGKLSVRKIVLDEDLTIEELNLSNRTYNCLKSNNILLLSQLLKMDDYDILKIRNLGAKSFKEIKEKKKEFASDLSTLEEKLNINKFFLNDYIYLDNNKILLKDKTGFILNVKLNKLQFETKFMSLFKSMNIESLFDLLSFGIDNLSGLDKVGKHKQKQIKEVVNNYILKYVIDCTNQSKSIQEVVSQTILTTLEDTVFEGMERVDLIEKLSEDFPKDMVVEELEKLLTDKKVFIFEGDKVFFKYQSFPSYVYHKTLGEEQIRDIMFSRLEGETLDEIGERYNVSRERIRQQEVKFLKNCEDITFREDRFKYMYEKYNFPRSEFSIIFNEKPRTINYLIMKYNHGSIDYKTAVDDEKITKRLRACIQTYLDRNKIDVAGILVEKNKGLEYFISRHITKLTRIDDIISMYNYFANKYGFDTIEDTTHNLEARISRIPNVIASINKEYRFYDFNKYDFKELLDAMKFEGFMNMQISTKLLFENNRKLMRKYDISSHYELHNILKKICDGKQPLLKFGRMPMITIGEFNKKEYLLEILREYQEIGVGELTKILEKRLGIETFTSSWTAEIEEFKEFGKYVYIEQKKMDQSTLEKVKLLLVEDFYFKDDIKSICKKNIENFDESLINFTNLTELGFTVNTTYVVKAPFNANSYVIELLTKDDIFNLNDLPGITRTSTFNEIYYKLRNDFTILEFEPSTFISIRKLENAGFLKQDLYDYVKQAIEFSNDEYFTLKSLKNRGFYSELEDLGFDNIFYESILKFSSDIQSTSFANVLVFKKESKPISRKMFFINLIAKYRIIETDDLLYVLKKEYGIETDISLLRLLIADTDIYYNPIMDTFYINYETFIKEI